jgi:hypothetical protein
MRFRAVLELNGRTATGVEVPGEVVAALDPSRRPAVKVTINGHSYGSTVAAMGGRFMLPVSAENRTAAGVAAGDEVEVELVLDSAPRVVTVPDDLRAALDAAPVAAQRFAALSYRGSQGCRDPCPARRQGGRHPARRLIWSCHIGPVRWSRRSPCWFWRPDARSVS